MKLDDRMELGLGLIGIGRAWGHVTKPLPTFEAVQELLKAAIDLGIRFFDTAPAYGASESRLGRFLAELDSDVRGKLIVATKCGEHWNESTGSTFVDHGYDALCKSIDRSFERLKTVDVLQVHKASIAVLEEPGLRRALRYALSRDVKYLGVSVSDVATAEYVARSSDYRFVQLPLNQSWPSMISVLDALFDDDKVVIVNRPLNMGAAIADATDVTAATTAAYRFIVEGRLRGVVLSGTTSVEHLRHNVECFSRAVVK